MHDVSTIPSSQPATRRRVLATLTAAAAATTIAGRANGAETGDDAPLFALLHDLRVADSAADAADDAEERAYETRPVKPRELEDPLGIALKQTWTRKDIERHREIQLNCLGANSWAVSKCDGLLQRFDEHTAKVEQWEIESGFTAAREAHDRAVDSINRTLEAIADTPARTLSGALVKAALAFGAITREEIRIKAEDLHPRKDIVVSLISDVLALHSQSVGQERHDALVATLRRDAT